MGENIFSELILKSSWCSGYTLKTVLFARDKKKNKRVYREFFRQISALILCVLFCLITKQTGCLESLWKLYTNSQWYSLVIISTYARYAVQYSTGEIYNFDCSSAAGICRGSLFGLRNRNSSKMHSVFHLTMKNTPSTLSNSSVCGWMWAIVLSILWITFSGYVQDQLNLSLVLIFGFYFILDMILFKFIFLWLT